MVAKRSNRALALLLALPSAAFALGLGDIRLLSPLNAPLDAEVELVDVAPDEVNTLQAQLASRETFARYGLEWPAYLAGVQVHVVHSPNGREMLKLKSTEAISEPFMTVLLEVSWSRGHLVREYTMMLDPPVYTPGQSAVASAPVTAPATGVGTREGAIARSADAPPVAAPAAPQPDAPAEAAPAAPRGAPPASSDSTAGSMHVVQRGETLTAIASDAASASANSARTHSWMLAIYQANPRAFDRNMNVMRSGAVMRIPGEAQATAVSAAEAAAEIRRQYAAWRSSSGAPTASSGEQAGRLKLVTPSESASVGATPGASSGAEVSRLQGQVHDLEGQLAESKRLLELKNAELARLQSELAAKRAAAAAPPPPPVAQVPPPAVTQAAPPPPPAPITEEKPPEATAPPEAAAPPAPTPAPPAPTPAPTPAPQSAKPAPVPPESAAGESLLDTLEGYWWEIALAMLVVVGVIAARFVRAQRAAQFDDSLGRLAVAGAEAVEASPPSRGFASGGFASGEPPMRATEPASREPGFVVEESGTHERPRLSLGAAEAAQARHVTADETISSETAINLDQGDPLAEADFHMAYGLYDQAADLIRIAIGREPARRDLRLKLLEVFFVWGNKEQFLQTARELADSRDEAAPGEWEKILIMGKQLAPEDPLFSGTGAVSGAMAGGVDLDLEGGQSRVDFDLLGEPGTADGQGTVDLDIGAAMGDQADSPTNVTDRNAALGGLGATGTTRQMTARLRQDLSTTTEVDAPTVEQPAFTQDQPTIRQKVETALKSTEQTAELALDDLGLDVGQVDTVEQPGLAAAAGAEAEGPTLVAGLDDRSRKVMDDAQRRAKRDEHGQTGAWQFDQDELEAALTQTSLALQDASATSRLAALGAHSVDVDIGEASSTHPSLHGGGVDLDVGDATGSHAANGGHIDVDVGTASVPDTAFAATQRLSSEDLALPDLEPVTMSEVGTKLDLARAYMDMGDPDGARNILEEVLAEGSAAQKQEAQRLMESLPG